MKTTRRATNALAWRHVEALESRTLLSGLPVSAGLVAAATPQTVGTTQSAPILLAAQLSSPGATPTASIQFAENTLGSATSICLAVEVQGAPANDTVSVSVGGVVVGTVTTNAQGGGVLSLATTPQGPQLPLPANFPTSVQSGTAVSLTDTSGAVKLGGTLATVAPNPNPPAQPPPVGAVVLNAQLAAAGSTATAAVQFTQVTDGPTAERILAVRVNGAPSGDAISVTVGGVVVGTINTGANGSGGLVLSSNPQGNQQALPANFPAIVAPGTALSLTDTSTLSLSGTFSNPPPAPTGSLLTAQLTGTGTTATATVQLAQFSANNTTNTLFAVQVQGATANDTLTVTLAGVSVGQITTDANGNGMLVLASNPQGNQAALPANFPTSVASGAAVTVADTNTLSLTGSLAAPPKQVPPGPPIPPPATPTPNATVLVSKLTGTSTTATSLVQFTQDTVNGTTFTLLSIQVHGAPANDALTVTLGGVAVGQLTTGPLGNGQLILSSNPQGPQQPLPASFPTSVASGATATVADASGLSLSGTLAAPAPAPIGTLLASQLTETGTTAIGLVQYAQFKDNGATTTVLAVQIQGAPATDTLTVTLGGVSVGTITTDAHGNGVLALSSDPEGQQQPLPANFPTSVASGATVAVTDTIALSLTGTLATPPAPKQGQPQPPPPPQAPAPTGSVLAAQLGAPGATTSASVHFTQDVLNGTTFTLFCVQVQGAPAADTLTVTLGGVSVGTITTDSHGNGSLILSSNPQGQQQALPANFPTTVATGATVSIADASSLSLSGALAAPAPAAIGSLLAAQLTGTGTTATAGVQLAQSTANGAAATVFAVQVQGAPAAENLTVTLAGVVVGKILTDAEGNGVLVLASNPQGQQQALPANFPTGVASGAAVSIADATTFSLTGTLATPPKPTQPGPPQPPAPPVNGTVYAAQLTGTGTAATSSVQFTQDTLSGTTYTSFSVHVSGAPANDTLSVLIGTVVVGTISTDANGNGVLCLSSNPQGKQSALPATFPTSLTSGTAVSVTDTSGLSLTGSLETPTPPPPAPWHNANNPLDVIGSGGPIVPLDALVLINYLNTQGAGQLPSAQPVGGYDLDVTGDNTVVPDDALKVIDYLNLNPSGTSTGSSAAAVTAAVTIAASGTIVAPQVTASAGVGTATTVAATSSSPTSAGPQLALGAGLVSSGSGSVSPSVAAVTAAFSSSPVTSTAPASSASQTVDGTATFSTLATGSSLTEASIDAVLSDPSFDFSTI